MTTFWKDKHILISGASGLVGYWLSQELVSLGAHVVALIRDIDFRHPFFKNLSSCVTTVSGELESVSTLERAIASYEIQYVFHLGAQTLVGTSYKNPLDTFEANIRGTYNLLEACRRQSDALKAVIIASSDKAYGASPILPYKENMPLQGKAPYEVSKSCADLLAQSYFHTYDLPILISRCGNIFGGGDLNWSRLIPGTIRSLLQNERPLLRSDGTYIRDYIYVKDVVRAYLLLAENAQGFLGEAFNFAPSQPHTVKTIVSTLLTLMDCDYLDPIYCNQAAHEIKDQYLSSEKATRLLGWRPYYTLEEGLKETILWYEGYLLSWLTEYKVDLCNLPKHL